MPRRGSAREAVVEAALRLFSRDSYSKVSVEEVASEAGVSKGAVFHYFKSKLELAEEALKLLLARLVTKPFWRIVNSEVSIEEKVRALLDLSLEVSSKYNARRLSFLIEVFRELERAGRETFIRSVYRSALDDLARVLEEAGVPNARARAFLLLAILDGLGVQISILGDELSPDLLGKVKEEVAEVILCGRAGG